MQRSCENALSMRHRSVQIKSSDGFYGRPLPYDAAKQPIVMKSWSTPRSNREKPPTPHGHTILLSLVHVSVRYLCLQLLHPSRMNLDTPTTSSVSDEDLDDPYIHTVSTEEFVESVEQDSHEENEEELESNED